MWLWPLKMTTQKLLRLLLLLMLTIRNMLTTFWCRFGRWFGHKVRFLFILWAQGFKVWSIFWSWCSGKILKLKFGHCFAVDASCDYEVQDRFGQELVIWPKEVTLISRTQPSGPLCLWQCFENETSRVILDNFPFVRAMHLLENILRSIWADIKRWY